MRVSFDWCVSLEGRLVQCDERHDTFQMRSLLIVSRVPGAGRRQDRHQRKQDGTRRRRQKAICLARPMQRQGARRRNHCRAIGRQRR